MKLKSILLASLFLMPTIASAHGNWVTPALIGGIIGYEIGTPRHVQPQVVYTQPPVVYQQPQVIYQQPPVVYQQPRQVYAYPLNVPTPPGMTCQIRSDNVNGQIITMNYCF